MGVDCPISCVSLAIFPGQSFGVVDFLAYDAMHHAAVFSNDRRLAVCDEVRLAAIVSGVGQWNVPVTEG